MAWVVKHFRLATSLLTILTIPAVAQDVSTGDEGRQSLADAKSFDQLITGLAQLALPDVYEDKDEWGKMKAIPTGVRVSRQGLRVKVRKREKEVNHGSWYYYRLEPTTGQPFLIEIGKHQTLKDGRLKVPVCCTSTLRTSGRLSRWNLGVQLLSVSAEANAKMRLTMDLVVGFSMGADKYGPTLTLKPRATDVRMEILDLKVLHISKLHGSLAKELGDELRRIAQGQLDHRREKLLRSINKELIDVDGKARLSLERFLSKTLNLGETADDSGSQPDTD